MKENPGMVRTFVEVTHEANARYRAGKTDLNVVAGDAGMDLAGVKKTISDLILIAEGLKHLWNLVVL